MTIRIGAGSLGWYQDDFAAPSHCLDREALLGQAARGGFDGATLGPRTAAEVGSAMAALARHQLAYVPHTHSLSLATRSVEAELAALQPRIDAARALGARMLTVCETTGAIHGDRDQPLSNRPQMSMIQWFDYGERLSELAAAVADQGVTLLVRPQMGTVLQTPGDIDQLVACTTPAVGLVLDVGQVIWGGGNPVEIARRYPQRIGLVQATDIDAAVLSSARARDLSCPDAIAAGIFAVPGRGAADIPAIFHEMPHFDGWIMVDTQSGGTLELVAHLRTVRPERPAIIRQPRPAAVVEFRRAA